MNWIGWNSSESTWMDGRGENTDFSHDMDYNSKDFILSLLSLLVVEFFSFKISSYIMLECQFRVDNLFFIWLLWYWQNISIWFI